MVPNGTTLLSFCGVSPLRLRVKEAREARGLSQSALSELAGVRRATIIAIEQGTTTGVDFDTLERLAKALEVEPSWLLVRARK